MSATNLTRFIALRYAFAKRKQNLVNLISRIAMLGISVSVFAMVVVLSAFNGLEQLVGDMYSRFDPDISISPSKGKWLLPDSVAQHAIYSHPAVSQASFSLEETAMLKYGDRQVFAVLKGVDDGFLRQAQVAERMNDGQPYIGDSANPYLLLGFGLAYQLELFLNGLNRPVVVYVAKPGVNSLQQIQSAFVTNSIIPSGIFTFNPDVDNQYALAPIGFVRDLTEQPSAFTKIDVRLLPESDAFQVKRDLEAILGSAYQLKTRYELNEVLYKTNATEKWITFLILSFILLIATFNLVGSVSLLIIEKKSSIQLFKALGMSQGQNKAIFIQSGMSIALLGAVLGMLAGCMLVILQQTIGLIPLSGGIVEFYPVALQLSDLLIISGLVLGISLLACWLPATILVSRFYANSN